MNYLNACQAHVVGCVSKIKSILSIVFNQINGDVCLQLTQISCDDRGNVCFIVSTWSHTLVSTTHFLSSLCRHIWRQWTSDMLVRYFWYACLSRVCLWLSQFPQSCNIWSCVFSAKLDSLMMILRLRVLDLIIIIKSQVWPICHCRGLGDETMVCAVCFSVFLSSSNR